MKAARGFCGWMVFIVCLGVLGSAGCATAAKKAAKAAVKAPIKGAKVAGGAAVGAAGVLIGHDKDEKHVKGEKAGKLLRENAKDSLD